MCNSKTLGGFLLISQTRTTVNNAVMENTSKTSFLENIKLKFLTLLYFNHGTQVGNREQINPFTLTDFHSAAPQGAVLAPG